MTSAPASGRKVIDAEDREAPMSIIAYRPAITRYEPAITISPIAMPSA